jgi:hypothetical protein
MPSPPPHLAEKGERMSRLTDEDQSTLSTADRRVIDNVISEALRTLAHMARGNADGNINHRDLDHLADIFIGKVKPL